MSVEITFLGHSAFKISDGKHNILVDPYLHYGNVEGHVDDILVTHAHMDHLGSSIEISKKTGAKITTIFELANYCSKKGAKSQGINVGGKVKFDWGEAQWFSATHSSSLPDGSYGGCASSIFIKIQDKTIYHAGDTGLHLDMKIIGELYSPYLSLLPIGSVFTMGTDDAVEAAKYLKTSVVIPMHYNTFDAIKADTEYFKEKLERDTAAKCVILKPFEKYSF